MSKSISHTPPAGALTPMRTGAPRCPCVVLARRGFLAALLLAFPACDGSLGCMSCGEGFVYPSPPPPGGELQRETLIGHLQESGIAFVASHLSDVLRARLPTRTEAGIERAIIYLPEATFGSAVAITVRDGCIGSTPPASCPARDDAGDLTSGPTYRSKLELNLDTVDDVIDVELLPGGGPNPDAVRVTLYDLDVFMDVAFMMDGVLVPGDAACRIVDDRADRPALHLEYLSFTLTLEVDAASRFSSQISDVDVEVGFFDDASLLNLSITPCNGGVCDDPACHTNWLGWECHVDCYSAGFLVNGVEFLSDILSPVIEWIAPDIVEWAVQATLDEVNGAPLAVSGRYDFGALFGGARGAADLLLDPTALSFGAYPSADTFEITMPPDGHGITVALDAGMHAEASPCVPAVAVPSFTGQLGERPFFTGTLGFDDHVERYHLGLAVSAASAAQGAHALYELGSMCLALTSEDMERLSSGAVSLGTLALLVPSLAEIGSVYAPLLFQIHPTAPPAVRFGTGAVLGHDEHGRPIVDSMVQLDFGELGLSIYAFVDDSYLRLATVAADVRLGLPIVRTPANTLEIGLDEVQVTEVVEVYDEIAGPADFATLVEVLISITFGSFVAQSNGFEIDLAPVVSSLLGGAPVFARINDVRRQGDATEGFLVAYVTFCDQQDLTDPARPPCYTPPTGQAVLPQPEVAGAASGPGGLPAVHRGPGVTLMVSPGREYQVRVDGVVWSGWHPPNDGELRVTSPLLKLTGVHRIEVASRLPGLYRTRTTAEPLHVLVLE